MTWPGDDSHVDLSSWTLGNLKQAVAFLLDRIAILESQAQTSSILVPITDDFNRADGAIGFPPWVPFNDGSLTISGNKAVGQAGLQRGNVHSHDMYPDDQYAEVTVSAAALASGDWLAAVVRSQVDPAPTLGDRAYVGIYFNNGGTYVLQLYKRTNSSTFVQLGATVTLAGALSAGQKVRVTATGSTVVMSLDGVAQITVTDATYISGYPGMATFGAAAIDAFETSGVLALTHGYRHFDQHPDVLTIAAKNVVIEDLGNHYTSNTVEGALQEIGAKVPLP